MPPAPIIGLAVVATGNHFVFDIAAGVAVTVAGYVVGNAVDRKLAARRPWRPQNNLGSPLPAAG